MGKVFKSHHGWFSYVNFNELFAQYFPLNNVKVIADNPWKWLLFLSLFMTTMIALSLPLGGVFLSLCSFLMTTWLGKQFYDLNVKKNSQHHTPRIVFDAVNAPCDDEPLAMSAMHLLQEELASSHSLQHFFRQRRFVGNHSQTLICLSLSTISADLSDKPREVILGTNDQHYLLQDVEKYNLRRTLNILQGSFHQHDVSFVLLHPFFMKISRFIRLMHDMRFPLSMSFEHAAQPQPTVLAITPPFVIHEQYPSTHYSCARPLYFSTNGVPVVMPRVSLSSRITPYSESLLHHLFAQYQKVSSNHMDEVITRDKACSLRVLCDEVLEEAIPQETIFEDAHAVILQSDIEDEAHVIDEQAIGERFKATAIRHEDSNKTMSQHLLKAIGVKRPVVSSIEPANTKVPVVSALKKTEVLSYASIVAKMRAELVAKNKSKSALKTVNTIQKNPHPSAKHATQQALAPKTFSQHLLHAAKQQKSTDMSSSGMHHVTKQSQSSTKQSQRLAEQSQRPAIDSRDPVLLSDAQTPATSSVLVSESIIPLTARLELPYTHMTSQINTACLPQFSFLAIDPNMMVADDKLEESNDELQNRLRDTVERYCAFLKGNVC